MSIKGQGTQCRWWSGDFLPLAINLGEPESRRENEQLEGHVYVCASVHPSPAALLYSKVRHLTTITTQKPALSSFLFVC